MTDSASPSLNHRKGIVPGYRTRPELLPGSDVPYDHTVGARRAHEPNVLSGCHVS